MYVIKIMLGSILISWALLLAFETISMSLKEYHHVVPHMTDFWYLNDSYIHVQNHSSDISNANIHNVIRWYNSSFLANCAPQIYNPILHQRLYDPYLLITDIMAINGATQVWIMGVEPNAMFSRPQKPIQYQNLFNHRVICAFNNGQTVVSHRIMHNSKIHYGIIIICDIPSALRYRILTTSQHTNIGVSIFDYNSHTLSPFEHLHIGDDIDANDTVSVEWINVSLPVCSSYLINNGNDIWYSHDSQHSNRASLDGLFRYKLGLCTTLNMNDVYYDENTKYIDYVIEFIEYYRLHGVEQIYLFDLQYGNTSIVYDYVNQYYIQQLKLVTYVDWHIPYTHPPVHKYSALNSCFRRFSHDNKYMINVDLDEFMFPASMQTNDFIKTGIRSLSTAIEKLNRQRDDGEEWTYIRMGCQWSGLCNEQQEVIDSFGMRMNHTFSNRLAMHLCRSSRWNSLSRYKYIINPRKIHYAFLHYIILYKQNETINQLELRDRDGISCIHAHKFPFKPSDQPRQSIPYLQHMDESKVLAHNILESRSKIHAYIQVKNVSFVVDKQWFSQTYGVEGTLWRKDGLARSVLKWNAHNVCIHGSKCNQACRDYLDDHFVHTCYNNTLFSRQHWRS
eukprot:79634_1